MEKLDGGEEGRGELIEESEGRGGREGKLGEVDDR